MTRRRSPRSLREFLNAEARAYGRFYYRGLIAEDTSVTVTRVYTCACGYRCTAARAIWAHVKTSHKKGSAE